MDKLMTVNEIEISIFERFGDIELAQLAGQFLRDHGISEIDKTYFEIRIQTERE